MQVCDGIHHVNRIDRTSLGSMKEQLAKLDYFNSSRTNFRRCCHKNAYRMER
jgi:hypothetical protein